MTKKKPGIKTGRPARHGGFSFLVKGVMPERRSYLRHYLTAIREGLVRDIAITEEGLTTAQRILVDRTVTFLGVIRLIEEWVREHGVLDSKGELSPSLSAHWLALNRNVKEYLVLLGIDTRRTEEVLDLAAYITAKGKTAKEATGGGQTKNEKASPAAGKGEEEIGAVARTEGEISGDEEEADAEGRGANDEHN